MVTMMAGGISQTDGPRTEYVLDFLGLKGAYPERDLEAAIIRNLEQFLSRNWDPISALSGASIRCELMTRTTFLMS